MSQKAATTSQKTHATSDENACNIKVETCPQVMKFFSAFKECYAMAQEIEVRRHRWKMLKEISL